MTAAKKAKRKQRAVATGETIASTSTPKKRKRYSANDEPSFNTTDLGNAKLFANLNGSRVLFDHKQGRWLVWNDARSRWQPDQQRKVWSLAKKVSRYRFDAARIAASGTEDEQRARKAAFKWAYYCESKRSISDFIELAKSEDSISDDGNGWDADPMLLGVANGVVDLRTGQFRAGTQNDRTTKFARVKFDATAKYPQFERFVDEIFAGDAELIRFIQKAAGYTLTGETSEQCLVALYGPGSNGKTTLLEIFFHILGDYAVDLPFSFFETKRDTLGDGSNLPGARFVKSVETRQNCTLDEAQIKKCTGQDTMTARPLYQNCFSFQPEFKLWLAFNYKPVVQDDSIALWRRLHLVELNKVFDGATKDKELPKKLRSEAPGILNWMLAGCLAWQQEGLEPIPEAVNRATLKYAAQSDHMTEFLEERCERDSLFEVPKNDLRIAYEFWCKLHRERAKNKNDFAQSMKSWGFGEGKNENFRFWTGLRLRPPDPVPSLADLSDPTKPTDADPADDSGVAGDPAGEPIPALEPSPEPNLGSVPDVRDAAADATDTTLAVSVSPSKERDIRKKTETGLVVSAVSAALQTKGIRTRVVSPQNEPFGGLK